MRIHQSMRDADDPQQTIPADRELIAQYLLLYEMSVQFGQDLSNQLKLDRSAFLLTVMLKKLKNDELIAIQDRADVWLQQQAPELRTPAASRSVLFAHLGQHVIQSMMTGAVVAIVLMTLALCVGLGSVRYGLISLVPNVLPAIVVYGFWGLWVKEVNMAAAVTFTISLGIVVDDTVHFLTKYKTARQQGDSAEAAIRYATTSAGTALITTTCVLAGAMLILGQSSFGINSSIAMMMVPILVVALSLDLLFLPALLMLVDKSPTQSVAAQASQWLPLPKDNNA
jgi:predicted RND superfamily exporter protein